LIFYLKKILSYIINLNFALESHRSFDNKESELLTLFSINDVESILTLKKGIKISLFKDFKINKNDRIAQMILTPVIKMDLEETNELPVSIRGERGFGSTGK